MIKGGIMKIGLRTIKTGIAVSLSMLTADVLGIESPFIVIITSIITIQPSISDSWKIGLNRILGTFIGAFVGILLLLIYPTNFLFAGVGAIIVIWIINKLGWKESVIIGGIVFISVYLYVEGNYFYHTLNRLLATIIGITIAVSVNYFIYPPAYIEKVTTKMASATRKIWNIHIKLFDSILEKKHSIEALSQEEICSIEKELNEATDFLILQSKEERIRIYSNNNYKEKQIILKMLKKTVEYLHNIYGVMHEEMDERVVDLYREDLESIKRVLCEHKDIEQKMVYNKGTTNLLNEIKHISKIKNRIKFGKNVNLYPTEEIVKMFVWMNNLEETLSKFNIIAERQEE